MMLHLIKIVLLSFSLFLLFACNKNDDASKNNSTPIFKGKIQNENGETLANQDLLLVRRSLVFGDSKIDTIATDNNGVYFFEPESNDFPVYHIIPDAPYFHDSTIQKSIALYDIENSTLEISGRKEIEEENEWDFFFCKKNTIEFQVQKTSPEFRACKILFHSPISGFRSGLELFFRRITINNIDTSFVLPFCQLSNISFSLEVRNEASEVIEEESVSLETLQNTPMTFMIEY